MPSGGCGSSGLENHLVTVMYCTFNRFARLDHVFSLRLLGRGLLVIVYFLVYCAELAARARVVLM